MEQKIIEIIKQCVKGEEIRNSINVESDIINDIGLDSLGLINFIVKLEDEFNIELDFNSLDISHLSSIENFCEYLHSQYRLT